MAPPKRDDPKIALLRSDREALKKALIEERRARGEKPTPVAIEKEILGIEREEAALRAIEAVEAASGTAVYRSVNLLDRSALEAVVEEIRLRHGRIDVLVHAGGVEISRKLSDKEPGEFDLVFDIKADGFFTLLKATADLPLGATLVFSSIAGRFGNSGQTDYSAANALLASMSSWLAGARPGTRAIAIDWTAWGGIGMATRGSIPKMMELAGIEMLPPEVGIATVRRELVAGGRSGEVVVAGKLGILGEEPDENGGLDVAKFAADLESAATPARPRRPGDRSRGMAVSTSRRPSIRVSSRFSSTTRSRGRRSCRASWVSRPWPRSRPPHPEEGLSRASKMSSSRGPSSSIA